MGFTAAGELLTGLGLFIGLAAFLTEPSKLCHRRRGFPHDSSGNNLLFTGSVYRWNSVNSLFWAQVPGFDWLAVSDGWLDRQ
ncbi:MAG: hypothetical protein CM1200mP29_14410 [Verrucomicrobiota bacterium]|nr:MAG: hypothetical protein CM1200mP29_14410 [Verrucomicrobiota bacterium]